MQVVTEEKVSVRKTLLNLSIGEEREFSCTDFPLSRCRVIASQIKKGSNHRFSIRSNKYGTAFFVTRLR
jgi:hypothetical protein